MSVEPVELDNSPSQGMLTAFSQGTVGMISHVSRFNYDYNKKYYAGFSFRRDGSSLAPESRWGNFWSVSAAWKVSRGTI
ncbi:MAG: hypothetical protein R2758_00645 [Bacteroidales bacterium]